MPKKKMPNIYVRQYREFENKPKQNKYLIIALIVVIIFAIGALGYQYQDLWMKKPQQITIIVPKETLLVYYPVNGGKLAEKKIDIKNNLSDKEKGDFIIKNLKALKSIPESLTLNELAVDSDNILYLNFSKDITEGKMSSLAEILKTFSIVNSFLGSFRNAGKVQLLVEGQPSYTLNGTVYTYKPIEFNKDLLED